MKYGTLAFSLALIFFSAAFLYAEEEQLFSPRNSWPKVNYALPGWIDIDSSADGNGTLPASGTAIIEISNPGHTVSRAGRAYSAISVGNDGRVILGKADEAGELPPLGTGSSVYVIPTKKTLQPVSGSSSIALKWHFNNVNDSLFTIVQVGPFRVDGLASAYSYQVLAYPDGELQLFWWRHDAEPFWDGSSHFRQEADVLGKSGLHNGYATQWSNARNVFLLLGKEEMLYSNFYGSLRPGWIAKSFDDDGVTFRQTASGEIPRINVSFGTAATMPGGLFAYDHSREHPVAGAFEYVKLNLLPKGGGKIVSWYFEEIFATTEAYYPSVDTLSVDSISQSCPGMMAERPGFLLPCMYIKSWEAAVEAGKKPEWIPAPAVKFQSMSSSDRELDITGIFYGLRQPRSVQFLPPEQYTLDLQMGAGGYALVKDMPRSSPYPVFSDRPVDVRLIAKPGQEIARVAVNGVEVYNGTSFVWSSSSYDPIYGLMRKDTASGEILISGKLSKNYVVVVEFSPCTGRELALPASPAYIQAETFLDPPGAGQRKTETYMVKDGFGRTVQTQQKLETGNFSVQGTYLDALGRTRYVPLPFVHPSSDYSYADMSCYQCITLSDIWHDGSDAIDRPDDMGFPFTETGYHGGEGGALQSYAGLGGASFALADLFGKEWAIPVPGPEAFVSKEDLNETNISNVYNARMSQAASQGGMGYVLRIVRDNEGRHRQSIQDGAGNALYTWAHDGSNILSTAQDYDALERPVKHYPSGREYAGLASVQELDGTGRARSVTSPDRGKVESRYDQYGRLRFVRTARHLAQGAGHFSAYEYDSLGRLSQTGEVKGGHSFENPDAPIAAGTLRPVTETVYGPAGVARLSNTGIALDAALQSEIAGQDVHPSEPGAVFAYDDLGNVVSLKAWSYDRLGRKKFQWIAYGSGIPPARLEYIYNLSGELATSFFSEWSGAGWVRRSERGREYDSQGRLAKVLEDGSMVAEYERSERGRLRSKTLYDKGIAVLTSRADKDISGRPLSFIHANGATLLYGESASYAGNSGRIAQATHRWLAGGQETVHSAEYFYDALGRLSEAAGSLGGQYGFDIAGRLDSKMEAGMELSYGYQDSYRPAWVKTNGQDSASLWDYDASGNLVRDLHGMATYRIGAGGLPVDVRVYGDASNMPNSVAQIESGQGFAGETHRVEMAYDEGGERILYRITNKTTGESYSEATIPGVAAYSQVNGGAWQLLRLELVEGGYRPGGTGDAFFAVSDVQGSVRGYARKGIGLSSAYGYYPYGMVHEIKGDGAADRARWQGKEFDLEHGKYYFGARFFDPYFGLWISPDPAGQFANPYTYGGDPLNYVDPDGEFIHIIVGAVVGAVGGAVQCGMTEQHCGKSILAGATVGAAAAATGGLVGGAVGGGVLGGALSGAAGGAVGGAGSYGSEVWRQGKDFSWGGLGGATGKGAGAGLVGGGVGGAIGSGALGAMGGGFAGGATGSLLNGGNGWDALKGGAIGAGIGLAVYSGVWAYANWTADNQMVSMEIAESAYEKGSADLAESQHGRKISSVERAMLEDFSEIMQIPEAQGAKEVAQYYKFGYRFWIFMGYAERLGDTKFFDGTIGNELGNPPKGTSAVIHSHPNYAFPSNTDLSNIAKFENLRGYIYYQPKYNSPPQLYHYDSRYYYRVTY